MNLHLRYGNPGFLADVMPPIMARGRQMLEQGTPLSTDRASIIALTVLRDFFLKAAMNGNRKEKIYYG